MGKHTRSVVPNKFLFAPAALAHGSAVPQLLGIWEAHPARASPQTSWQAKRLWYVVKHNVYEEILLNSWKTAVQRAFLWDRQLQVSADEVLTL